MDVKDKLELVRLLRLYQDEVIEKNDRNINNENDLTEALNQGYSHESLAQIYDCFTYGNKAQFEHARCIISKLDVEISKSIKWRTL